MAEAAKGSSPPTVSGIAPGGAGKANKDDPGDLFTGRATLLALPCAAIAVAAACCCLTSPCWYMLDKRRGSNPPARVPFLGFDRLLVVEETKASSHPTFPFPLVSQLPLLSCVAGSFEPKGSQVVFPVGPSEKSASASLSSCSAAEMGSSRLSKSANRTQHKSETWVSPGHDSCHLKFNFILQSYFFRFRKWPPHCKSL